MKQCVTVLMTMILLVGCATAPTSKPPTEVKLDILMTQALAEEFMPDREIVVSYVEIPPNTTLDRHWHPGEEFAYFLEGEVETKIDGQPVRTVKAGDTAHIPFRVMHTVTSGPEGARLIVFRVHTEGEPVRYLEEGGSSDH